MYLTHHRLSVSQFCTFAEFRITFYKLFFAAVCFLKVEKSCVLQKKMGWLPTVGGLSFLIVTEGWGKKTSKKRRRKTGYKLLFVRFEFCLCCCCCSCFILGGVSHLTPNWHPPPTCLPECYHYQFNNLWISAFLILPVRLPQRATSSWFTICL